MAGSLKKREQHAEQVSTSNSGCNVLRHPCYMVRQCSRPTGTVWAGHHCNQGSRSSRSQICLWQRGPGAHSGNNKQYMQQYSKMQCSTGVANDVPSYSGTRVARSHCQFVHSPCQMCGALPSTCPWPVPVNLLPCLSAQPGQAGAASHHHQKSSAPRAAAACGRPAVAQSKKGKFGGGGQSVVINYARFERSSIVEHYVQPHMCATSCRHRAAEGKVGQGGSKEGG